MELVVAGVKPYDGAYRLDLEQELTTREWGWIKRLAGYLPLQVTDETFGDPELACALTIIAMRRAGRIDATEVPGVFDRLADAPFGAAITVQDQAEDGDADGPPPVAGPSENAGTSGDASATSSETPAAPRRATGTPGSAISASAPMTLAT